MKLILGSSSSSRRELMNRLAEEFEVISPDIDEKAIRHENPGELVRMLSAAKSQAVVEKAEIQKMSPAVIVTSDQVVVFDSEIREKPKDEAEARQWIMEAHLHPAETWTGVHAINTEGGRVASGLDVAKVWFKPIPKEMADRLLAKDYWRYSSGGFDVEDELVKEYVDRREGDVDSVMGLPLQLTRRLIEEVGGEELCRK
jgi:septum formation protein